MLLAMHRNSTDVKGEAAVIAEWVVLASSCIVTFKLIDDAADIMLYQDNQREELVGIARAVPRSGMQRILQVVKCLFYLDEYNVCNPRSHEQMQTCALQNKIHIENTATSHTHEKPSQGRIREGID